MGVRCPFWQLQQGFAIDAGDKRQGCKAGRPDSLVSSVNVCLVGTSGSNPGGFQGRLLYQEEGRHPSWIAQAIVQNAFMEHISPLVEGVQTVDPVLSDKLKSEVLAKFANPLMFNSTCPVPVSSPVVVKSSWGEQDGEVDNEVVDVEESEDYMQQLRENLPKAGQLLAEVCKKSAMTALTIRCICTLHNWRQESWRRRC